MLNEVELNLDGRAYLWTHDPEQPVEASWRFTDQTFLAPAAAVVSRLKQCFLEQALPHLIESIESRDEFARLAQILITMEVYESAGKTLNTATLRGPYADLFKELIHRTLLAVGSDQVAVAGRSPFDELVLRDWFFPAASEGWGIPEEYGDIALCIGRGPFAGDDWRQFVRRCGVEAIEPGTDTSFADIALAILGREEWDKSAIDRLIDTREGKTLRILSQEMFLCCLGPRGRDIFAVDRTVLNAFRTTHPALQHLSQGWRGWVQVWVAPMRPGSGVREAIDFAEESFLAACSYHVGKTAAINIERRRAILRFVFEVADIAAGFRDWGPAGSPARLKSIAEHLVWLIKESSRKRSVDMSVAKGDWKDDLAWLRVEFYRGWMKFRWPSTDV